MTAPKKDGLISCVAFIRIYLTLVVVLLLACVEFEQILVSYCLGRHSKIAQYVVTDLVSRTFLILCDGNSAQITSKFKDSS